MMNCQQTKANFDERLDQRLDASSCAAFDAHLHECPACAAAWRAYAAAWNALSRHTAPEPSVGFVERTVRRLEETLTDRSRVWLAPLWRWVLAGAVGAALALGGWWGWQTQTARKTDAQVELYVMAQQDRLEDFDVVAALHLLVGDNP